ncbi:MAG: NifB/NifX family molybdenum-iron cluster-binding protein [Candidatus Aenigmarchaeota archaeon]|nr:NifB/NifX family molybdenum-iron cluster-binding protein [Candidatus Aenigmarchaeota archaeon]
MKIAIPTDGKNGLDERVAYHFGRCATYTILDEEGNVVEIIDNTSEHFGGRGMPAELLKERNVDVLLCRGIGPRAIELANNLGMDVYVGEAESVKDMFKLWKSGKLKKATLDDTCGDHKV